MRVSVVIPCYNCESFIRDSVQSVFEQRHEDIELICIDNNSSDSTWEVLEQLKSENPSIIIDKESKPGAPAARNRGWRSASGDWVQFLDADDILLPDKISSQVRIVGREPTAGLIISDHKRLELGTGKEEEVHADRNKWTGLINNQLGITSANLFKRMHLEEVEGFDESLKSSQEYDLMFRLMKGGVEVVFSEGIHTVIRSRAEGSISKTDVSGNKHRFLNLTSRIAGYLKVHERDIYESLGDKWFQDMFIRIRMNAIDGHPDSGHFFSSILPEDFKPEARPFTPSWFRLLMSMVGYERAEKIRSFIK